MTGKDFDFTLAAIDRPTEGQKGMKPLVNPLLSLYSPQLGHSPRLAGSPQQSPAWAYLCSLELGYDGAFSPTGASVICCGGSHVFRVSQALIHIFCALQQPTLN